MGFLSLWQALGNPLSYKPTATGSNILYNLRARDSSKANILYIDLDIPKSKKGQQINRSYQNLSLLSSLGHRITVVSYHETTNEKCDLQCREDIQKYGIEVTMGSWYELAEKSAVFMILLSSVNHQPFV